MFHKFVEKVVGVVRLDEEEIRIAFGDHHLLQLRSVLGLDDLLRSLRNSVRQRLER